MPKIFGVHAKLAKIDAQAITMTLTSSSVNPTKGTVTYETCFYERDGSDMIISYSFNQTSAGTGGTGIYFLNLPGGFVIDATKQIRGPDGSSTSPYVGSGAISGDPGQFTIDVIADSTTRLRFQITNATNTGDWGSTLAAFGNTNLRVSWTARVPIVGWKSSDIVPITP